MSEFPKSLAAPSFNIHITPFSMNSMGGSLFVGASGSATWSSANRAVFYPFRITTTVVIERLFTVNGSTAAGNLDIGIYDEAGTKIVSTGSTAQVGTSGIQEISITPTELGPGLFYMALSLSSTSGTIFRQSRDASISRAFGMAQQASALPLPATATFATITTADMPYFGASGRSFI